MNATERTQEVNQVIFFDSALTTTATYGSPSPPSSFPSACPAESEEEEKEEHPPLSEPSSSASLPATDSVPLQEHVNQQPDRPCHICLEAMTNSSRTNTEDPSHPASSSPDTVVFLSPCRHEFHYRCIRNWIRVRRQGGTNIECPVCRSSIDLPSATRSGSTDGSSSNDSSPSSTVPLRSLVDVMSGEPSSHSSQLLSLINGMITQLVGSPSSSLDASPGGNVQMVFFTTEEDDTGAPSPSTTRETASSRGTHGRVSPSTSSSHVSIGTTSNDRARPSPASLLNRTISASTSPSLLTMINPLSMSTLQSIDRILQDILEPIDTESATVESIIVQMNNKCIPAIYLGILIILCFLSLLFMMFRYFHVSHQRLWSNNQSLSFQNHMLRQQLQQALLFRPSLPQTIPPLSSIPPTSTTTTSSQ